MGVTGLLPFVKKHGGTVQSTHVKNFKGHTAAVDGYAWLHKGAFSCADKLVQNIATDAYVNYFMKCINVLKANQIKPIVVFDGLKLPSKSHVDKKRTESREANRKKALDLVQRGKDRDAFKYFQGAVSISQDMVYNVMKALRLEEIDYIVAPYEADAQLTYLVRKGFVDLVITEDSDLILFGCPKMLFKFKYQDGTCEVFTQENLYRCMDVSFEKFSFDRFRYMCILSGCDYLESLQGVGLIKAKKFAITMTGQDIEKTLKNISEFLRLNVEVTDEYIQGFIQANNTFLYQLVFDPKLRKLVPLNPYPYNVDPKEMLYAGNPDLDNKLALEFAQGNLQRDLKTINIFPTDKKKPSKGFFIKKTSIWDAGYQRTTKRNEKRDLINATKHTSTAGMTRNLPSQGRTSGNRRLELTATNEEETTEQELIDFYATDAHKTSSEPIPSSSVFGSNPNDSDISSSFPETRPCRKKARLDVQSTVVLLHQDKFDLTISPSSSSDNGRFRKDHHQLAYKDSIHVHDIQETSPSSTKMKSNTRNPFVKSTFSSPSSSPSKSPDIGFNARLKEMALNNSNSNNDNDGEVDDNMEVIEENEGQVNQKSLLTVISKPEKNHLNYDDPRIHVKSQEHPSVSLPVVKAQVMITQDKKGEEDEENMQVVEITMNEKNIRNIEDDSPLNVISQTSSTSSVTTKASSSQLSLYSIGSLSSQNRCDKNNSQGGNEKEDNDFTVSTDDSLGTTTLTQENEDQDIVEDPFTDVKKDAYTSEYFNDYGKESENEDDIIEVGIVYNPSNGSVGCRSSLLVSKNNNTTNKLGTSTSSVKGKQSKPSVLASSKSSYRRPGLSKVSKKKTNNNNSKTQTPNSCQPSIKSYFTREQV